MGRFSHDLITLSQKETRITNKIVKLVWDFDCWRFAWYILISQHDIDCKQTWCKKIYLHKFIEVFCRLDIKAVHEGFAELFIPFLVFHSFSDTFLSLLGLSLSLNHLFPHCWGCLFPIHPFSLIVGVISPLFTPSLSVQTISNLLWLSLTLEILPFFPNIRVIFRPFPHY